MKYLFPFLFCALAGCSHKKEASPPPSFPVHLATVEIKDVPIFLEGLGHVDPMIRVALRSRIEGNLTGVFFKQGQEVKEGDLLFTIDPKPYEAALKQAKGLLEQSTANLALAQEKVKRYQSLLQEEFYSQIDYETLQSSLAANLAQVTQAEAQVDGALINLDYCWIYAPISGVISILDVDFGNLVGNNQAQQLATLNQISPIYVTFSLPEVQLPQIQKYQRKGCLKTVAAYEHFQGELYHAPLDLVNLEDHQSSPSSMDRSSAILMQYGPRHDSSNLSHSEALQNSPNLTAHGIFEGVLEIVNNEVDPETGMIKLRAVFENNGRELWPGQFVRIRLILYTQKDALQIPYTSVQMTSSGPVAFVAKDNMTVDKRLLKLGQRQGEKVIVLEGLQAGETVVLEGQLNLTPGAHIYVPEQR